MKRMEAVFEMSKTSQILSLCFSVLYMGCIECAVVAKCGPPPAILNTKIMPRWTESSLNGTILKYRCSHGYNKEGALSIICFNGQWHHQNHTETISCTRKVCPWPNVGQLVSIDGTDYRFGEEVTFQCPDGYKLQGESHAICQADGTWDISTEYVWCQPVMCKSIDHLENGQVIQENLDGLENDYGSVAHLKCQEDYRLVGSRKRVCQANGLWSGEDTRCKELYCDGPDLLVNGIIEMSSRRIGSVIVFRCTEGFSLKPGSRGTSVCRRRKNPDVMEWSQPTPECHASCSRLIIGNSSYVSNTANEINSGVKVSFQCKNGYTKNVKGKVTCLKNEWLPAKPTCTPKSCHMLRALNLKISLIRGSSDPQHSRRYSSGSQLQVKCRGGFEFRKSVAVYSITCNLGIWSMQPPLCLLRKCIIPTSVNGHFVRYYKEYNNTAFANDNAANGTIISLVCDGGYFTHSGNSVCVQGKWQDQPSHCQSVHDHGEHCGADVECAEPLTCEENRCSCSQFMFWETDTDSCQHVWCELPSEQDLENTELYFYRRSIKIENMTKVKAPAKVCVRCSDGYTLIDLEENKPFSYCVGHGWTWPLPKCSPINPQNCSLPDGNYVMEHPAGVKDISDGSAVSVTCRGRQGHTNIICHNGQWSDSFPICPYRSFCSYPYGFQYVLTNNVTNMVLQSDMIEDGVTIDVQCEGTPLNRTRLTCSDGVWSTKFPICQEGFCVVPSQNIYTVFSYEEHILEREQKVANGSVVILEYICNRDWTNVNRKNLTCISGSWSELLPVCQLHQEEEDTSSERCRLPWDLTLSIILADGMRVAGGFIINNSKSVTLECQKGYETRRRTVTCKNGNWDTEDGLLPECRPVPCEIPTFVPEQIVRTPSGEFSRQVQHGSNVGLTCPQMDKELNFICEFGIWDSVPMCPVQREEPKVEFCDRPPVLNVNYEKKQMYRVGDVVKVYDCPGNLEFRGTKLLHCLNSGQWSSYAECVEYCKNGRETWSSTAQHVLDLPADRELGRLTLMRCQQACQSESKFLCRSIKRSWYGYCHLSSNSRQTKPQVFKYDYFNDYSERDCDDSCEVPEIRDGRLIDWNRYDLKVGSKKHDQEQVVLKCYGNRYPIEVSCGGGKWQVEQSVDIDKYCNMKHDECQVRPGVCQNGGTCLVEDGRHVCYCSDGWTSMDCSVDIDDCWDKPCLNSGQCIDYKGVSGFLCECIVGWTGLRCENEDACLNSPCPAGQVCQTFNSRYVCSCRDGWRGVECSQDINECDDNPCGNGGTCMNTVGNFFCVCAMNFTGPTCHQQQQPENRESCSKPSINPNVQLSYNNQVLDEDHTIFPHGAVLKSRCSDIYKFKFMGKHKMMCNDGVWSEQENASCIAVGSRDQNKLCQFPTLKVVVYKAWIAFIPKIDVDGTILVPSGSFLRILCTCTHLWPKFLTFTKEVEHRSLKTQYQGEFAMIEIRNTSWVDTGIYHCKNINTEYFNSVSINIEVHCQNITSILTETLRVSITSLSPGGRATFFCVNPAFVLNMSQPLQCKDDGTWNNFIPSCQYVSCADPGRLLNGQVESGRNSIGDTAEYSCADGYVLSGQKSAICNEEGQWSTPTPFCMKESVKCPNPGIPENGEMKVEGLHEFSLNSFATFSCDSGYTLVGDYRISCRMTTGYPQWSATTPTCV